MIHCKPKSIFSWDFILDGEGHHASLDFEWFGEQGAITADGTHFKVRKHGMFSGHWTLDHEGQEIASAQKQSVFTRTFDIQSSSGSLVLRAESPFGNSFRVERSGELLATISRVHLLTRRTIIETIAQKWDFPTISFSFWLVALTWRRSAESSEGGGGGG
jgi:hypothetical protein